MDDGKLEIKPIYDDAILEGTITGAELTKRFQCRNRRNNTAGSLIELISGRIAGRLSRKKGGDGIVAHGIATALQASIIVYGKVGEEFFKNKLAPKGIEFSQREYSKRCAASIVSTYRGERASKIVEGVLAAIDNIPDAIEANAAKAGIMITEYTLERKNNEKVYDDYYAGKIIDSESVFARLDEMNYENLSAEEKIQRLEKVYSFVERHKDKINFDPLRKCFADIKEEELIAFYIANLDEVELGRAITLANKEEASDSP